MTPQGRGEGALLGIRKNEGAPHGGRARSHELAHGRVQQRPSALGTQRAYGQSRTEGQDGSDVEAVQKRRLRRGRGVEEGDAEEADIGPSSVAGKTEHSREGFVVDSDVVKSNIHDAPRLIPSSRDPYSLQRRVRSVNHKRLMIRFSELCVPYRWPKTPVGPTLLGER